MDSIFRSKVLVHSVNVDKKLAESGTITLEGADGKAVEGVAGVLAATNAGNPCMDVRKMVGVINAGGMVRAKYKSLTPRKNAAKAPEVAPAPVAETPAKKSSKK